MLDTPTRRPTDATDALARPLGYIPTLTLGYAMPEASTCTCALFVSNCSSAPPSVSSSHALSCFPSLIALPHATCVLGALCAMLLRLSRLSRPVIMWPGGRHGRWWSGRWWPLRAVVVAGGRTGPVSYRLHPKNQTNPRSGEGGYVSSGESGRGRAGEGSESHRLHRLGALRCVGLGKDD
jgi:hypothetical protein